MAIAFVEHQRELPGDRMRRIMRGSTERVLTEVRTTIVGVSDEVAQAADFFSALIRAESDESSPSVNLVDLALAAQEPELDVASPPSISTEPTLPKKRRDSWRETLQRFNNFMFTAALITVVGAVGILTGRLVTKPAQSHEKGKTIFTRVMADDPQTSGLEYVTPISGAPLEFAGRPADSVRQGRVGVSNDYTDSDGMAETVMPPGTRDVIVKIPPSGFGVHSSDLDSADPGLWYCPSFANNNGIYAEDGTVLVQPDTFVIGVTVAESAEECDPSVFSLP